MSTNKIIQALGSAAGSAGGAAGPNVEEVFSTYLYTGNGSTQTITNGIDLDGEDGMVWIKNRDNGFTNYRLVDTVRGATKSIVTNGTTGETTQADGLTAFTSSGFTLGADVATGGDYNNLTTDDYVSWTFRKARKFFDVVTYTGDGALGRTISHNLGSVPGFIMIKRLNTSGSYVWSWHNYFSSFTSGSGHTTLGTTIAAQDSAAMFGTHSSTSFTVQNNSNVNASGSTYVAYLFAHNNGNGNFGPDGDADIIKCGSFTTDSGGNFSEELGFEPQWILVKGASNATHSMLFDNMRGIPNGSRTQRLIANSSIAEDDYPYDYIYPTQTGFESGTAGLLPASNTYIYVAIRRGPMAVPESASEVFDVNLKPGAAISSGLFVANSMLYTDMALSDARYDSNGPWISDRLRSKKYNFITSTGAEATDTAGTNIEYDHQYGMKPWFASQSDSVFWAWKRAPSFFDVVAYTGDGTASHTINHNLGVVPEMIWTKNRSSATALDWAVYHSGIGRKLLILNNTDAETSYDFFPYDPTSSNWIVRNHPTTNTSGDDYIMYLFASLDGVSKVGSYTGNGSSQTIDCGFTSGARFVLIKGSSFADNWWVFDTERGIVTGNDPRLYLNTTDAEFSFDYVDPYSAGFAVNAFLSSNGQTYIFYAVA